MLKIRKKTGLLNAGRYGVYHGKICIFTHMKPGYSYTEELFDPATMMFGMWIPNHKINFGI